MTAVSKSDFARLYKVSHTTVNNWKKAGWLVMEGDQVNLEASNEKLATYRDSKDGRARCLKPRPESLKHDDESLKPETGNETGKVSTAADEQIEFLPGESVEQAAERLTSNLPPDLNMPVEEAKRVKEIYLALLNRLEYEQKSGALIELTAAQDVLFEAFRAQRDAWLNWPVKIGPMLAAELGLEEADRVTGILAAYVHKQIADLGEPDIDLVDTKK